MYLVRTLIALAVAGCVAAHAQVAPILAQYCHDYGADGWGFSQAGLDHCQSQPPAQRQPCMDNLTGTCVYWGVVTRAQPGYCFYYGADAGGWGFSQAGLDFCNAQPPAIVQLCKDRLTEHCYKANTFGAPNHCSANADNRYDIWRANCHTAANNAVLDDMAHTGIVACGGTPELQTNPQNHTAVYRQNPDGTTTYWNWNTPCGPCAGAPDPAVECHRQCIETVCGDQFSDATRILPPGTLVEIPGPSACVTEVKTTLGFPMGFSRSHLDACRACCARRADMWSNTDPGNQQRGGDASQFRQLCQASCDAFLGSPSTFW